MFHFHFVELLYIHVGSPHILYILSGQGEGSELEGVNGRMTLPACHLLHCLFQFVEGTDLPPLLQHGDHCVSAPELLQ